MSKQISVIIYIRPLFHNFIFVHSLISIFYGFPVTPAVLFTASLHPPASVARSVCM